MGQHKVLVSAAIALVASAAVAALNPPPKSELDSLKEKETEVQLKFQRIGLDQVFSALAGVAMIHVQIEGQLPAVVNVDIGKTSLLRTLQLIRDKTGVSYRVPDPNTLIVIGPAQLPEGEIDVIDTSLRRSVETEPTTGPTQLDYELPDYPVEALGIQTAVKVAVHVLVGSNGAVRDVTVMGILPPALPSHRAFEEAAVAAVKRWHYAPARKNGLPVAAVADAIIEFAPRDVAVK
jgi:TonB family protein